MNDYELSPLAARIRELLAAHTLLPDAILKAQCKQIGKTPGAIVATDLPDLAPRVGAALGMFTNPAKGRAVEQAILALR